ncbi:hypothetical protein HJFPF1_07703 [Paramyrothecium foliicola]|nr:hypothetical protein HJFPF1_07703 [Paramyrothecium foliicola]
MTTPEVAAQLAKSETQTTRIGPVAGRDAAAAQSLIDKERNLAAKVSEVNNKPVEEISKGDAMELQSRQDRVLGTGARTPGSLAVQIQSQVDHNEAAKYKAIRNTKQTEIAGTK